MSSSSAGVVNESSHPLILHKITQMRKASNTPKYLQQLMKEVCTFLCYEATANLPLEPCEVKTCVGAEAGQHIAARVGIVPVLRGGLGMVESMTEMVSNAQVWHLGIYKDKKSLLPIEYYNKLPKKVTVHTVYVLDPMPISGATAVAAMDILKAWGEGLKPTGRTLAIKFVCIVASEAAIKFITEAHPDVTIHVGLIDKQPSNGATPKQPVMPGMGDIADRLFGTNDVEVMMRAHAYITRKSCSPSFFCTASLCLTTTTILHARSLYLERMGWTTRNNAFGWLGSGEGEGYIYEILWRRELHCVIPGVACA